MQLRTTLTTIGLCLSGVLTIAAGVAPPMPPVEKSPIIQQPIPIFGMKRMATFAPDTGEVVFEKNVTPEDVVYVLFSDLRAAKSELTTCQSDLQLARVYPKLSDLPIVTPANGVSGTHTQKKNVRDSSSKP